MPDTQSSPPGRLQGTLTVAEAHALHRHLLEAGQQTPGTPLELEQVRSIDICALQLLAAFAADRRRAGHPAFGPIPGPVRAVCLQAGWRPEQESASHV